MTVRRLIAFRALERRISLSEQDVVSTYTTPQTMNIVLIGRRVSCFQRKRVRVSFGSSSRREEWESRNKNGDANSNRVMIVQDSGRA
jgi:hypothetical protein